MSTLNDYYIKEVCIWCAKCDNVEFWCGFWECLEINIMKNDYYVKGVLTCTHTHTLKCMNEVNELKCGIVG